MFSINFILWIRASAKWLNVILDHQYCDENENGYYTDWIWVPLDSTHSSRSKCIVQNLAPNIVGEQLKCVVDTNTTNQFFTGSYLLHSCLQPMLFCDILKLFPPTNYGFGIPCSQIDCSLYNKSNHFPWPSYPPDCLSSPQRPVSCSCSLLPYISFHINPPFLCIFTLMITAKLLYYFSTWGNGEVE